MFNRPSKDDIHAVRDLYLNIPQNTLFTILGHNGAGKSTLIGMLTGILNPTKGKASILGLDIYNEMNHARKRIGVCP